MTAAAESTSLLRQQIDYYRARAAEYDQWWLREGRYDRSPELNAQWFAEADEMAAALSAFQPAGRILELACGTGLWTRRLRPFAATLTAVDASPEMLALNAARPGGPPQARYIEADLFNWQPDGLYDTVFFSFWLSHVPPERFDAFWSMVRSCLAPGGRVFFVDSLHEPTSTAVDHRLLRPEATVLSRRLNDGRGFQIYKVFHDPAELAGRLRGLGWEFEIRRTAHYFLHASGGLLSL
ncbi:MAG: class I SAM-dependent methyltransferase [Verrucomicrobiaceae bacterium]|nr:MAG: class I SAM-dependent methyltransferase [Verrucomicrobiaceae bacterium]